MENEYSAFEDNKLCSYNKELSSDILNSDAVRDPVIILDLFNNIIYRNNLYEKLYSSNSSVIEEIIRNSQDLPGSETEIVIPGKSKPLYIEIIRNDGIWDGKMVKMVHLHDVTQYKNIENILRMQNIDLNQRIDLLSEKMDQKISEFPGIEEMLLKREKLLRAAFDSIDAIVTGGSVFERIPNVLEYIGMGLDASHAYLLTIHKDDENPCRISLSHEWRAFGFDHTTQTMNYTNIPVERSFLYNWIDELYFGNTILKNFTDLYDIKDDLLLTKDVRSILLVPIKIEKNLWGIMGFDDTLKDRHLDHYEISCMKVVAETISTAIKYKKMNDEHTKVIDKIEYTQKLENLGLLASKVAHDFNNLLLTIVGNTSLIMKDLTKDSAFFVNLTQIEKAALRASTLCKQLLSYAKPVPENSEPVSLSSLVYEMANIIEITISKNSRLIYDLDKNTPNIEIDKIRFQQVLMNIILNASESYGGKPGVVRVSTGRLKSDLAYFADCQLLHNLCEAEYGYVSISDQGAGMNQEILSKIFTPFFTTKEKGCGLGLSAAIEIIDRCKGLLKVKSTPGKGTSFTIYFPISNKSIYVANTPNESVMTKQIRVLVVDDQENVRRMVEKLLEKAGYDSILAISGEEAISIFERDKNNIDLVLLDMTMPGIDGRETFLRLKQIKKDITVVLSSGYNEQEIITSFCEEKPEGFLQKPYGINQLISKINEVMNSSDRK